jgi:prephenate dehydrogenase
VIRVRVGIIGGTGKMGRFFRDVFERAGYTVEVAGRATPLTPRDLAPRCDILVVSVPIRDTVRVIGEVAPLLSEDQVFTDLTSLKSGPVRAMLASKARVVGLHPMFGPSAPGLAGQTIIATPARCDRETLESLLRVFRSQGARITITSPEEHDRIMAVVQGLTHFVTLGVAETMRRLGMDPAGTEAYRSPVYQLEIGLVGRLLSQDPGLYADMLMLNPSVPPVLRACQEAVSTLKDVVEKGEVSAFEELFALNARNCGDYCEAAARETDAIIQGMVGR